MWRGWFYFCGCRLKFYDEIIVMVKSAVCGLLHVDEIVLAVVETVAVFMMTNHTEWGAGNKAMHREIELFTVFADGCFGIPVVLAFDGPPEEFT